MAQSRVKTQRIEIGGRAVALNIRRVARARRLTLRIDAAPRSITLVVPWNVPYSEGLRFVSEQSAWIARELALQPGPVPFEAGARIPFRGEIHTIDHRPGARRGVWQEPGLICVSGMPDHLSRRVTDFLRKAAHGDLSGVARRHATSLGCSIKRIVVRDTVSRWGSCSADGVLSFSWRLVLAPPAVLDYVAAHEAAHLREMNHGRRFWTLVRDLTPDMAAAQAWLAENGPDLHRFGAQRST